jgi:MoaA/NifB/PqqE/SkfB family radical SAM enzyme
MEEAKDLGMRVLVIAGEGEPLLDVRLPEVVRKADETGLIPYIFTNGSRLDKDFSQFLKNHNASLVINVDSLRKKTYEELAGTDGSFDDVIENLKVVRDAFVETYSQIEHYGLRRIAINAVVSKRNMLEIFTRKQLCGEEDAIIQPFQDFCGDDFVLVYNLPITIGRASADRNFDLSDADKELVHRLLEDLVPLGTRSDGIWCAYMRNGISVGATGEILTCAYSLESAGLLGNVREGGLKGHLGVANSVTDNFYGRNGHSRCILRHPCYGKFIQELQVLK